MSTPRMIVVAAVALVGLTCTDEVRRGVGGALSDAGRLLADAGGPSDAHAQTPSGDCLRWEVSSVMPPVFRGQQVTIPNLDGTTTTLRRPVVEAFALPDGWEPFAAQDLGAVMVRRCLAR